MPELPEVETVKRGLNKFIVGRVITSEKHDTEKGFPNAPADVKNFMIGAKIREIRRRAKVLMIDLSTDYTLVIHLKMTGQLVYVAADATRFGAGHPNDSLINNLPDKSTRVTITFEDDSHLYFNDQRKFGWMRLMPTVVVSELPFMQKVGPEPLENSFTFAEFKQRFERRKNSAIKAALLDQSVIAGVGNIYADEALWSAKIHPLTRVGDISDAKMKALYDGVREVMNLSISLGGSSSRNYVHADGSKGRYLDFAKVFHREGTPCPRCGAEILKTRAAGRGTHLCPREQVLGK